MSSSRNSVNRIALPYINGIFKSFDKVTGKIRAIKSYIFDKEENLKKIEEEIKNEIQKR